MRPLAPARRLRCPRVVAGCPGWPPCPGWARPRRCARGPAPEPRRCCDPRAASPRARITVTEHGIPHIVASDYESLGYGEGFATAQTQHLHAGRHGAHRPGPAVALPRARRAVRRPRHARRDEPADRHAVRRHPQPRVVQQLLADPKRRPGPGDPGAGARLRGRREQATSARSAGADGRHRPGLPRPGRGSGANVTPSDIWSAIYARQPARVGGRLRARRSRTPRRRRRPTRPTRCRRRRCPPGSPRRRTDLPTADGHCVKAARQGPGRAVRLQRHRRRLRRRPPPAAACCSATRTSRGAGATGSPSSS